MTIADVEKIAILYKQKHHSIEKTLHFLENRLTQKTTNQAILKSFGILLYHEFKEYLNIGDDKAKMYIADIMGYVFDTKVNDDEYYNTCRIAITTCKTKTINFIISYHLTIKTVPIPTPANNCLMIRW